MEVINTAEAIRKIYQTASGRVGEGYGEVFSVTFKKRNSWETREMRCRLGSTTRKGIAGGQARYNPQSHGLIWVYLMAGDENRSDSRNRRSIPVEGIRKLVIGGREFIVE
jgi:hypothetical protein